MCKKFEVVWLILEIVGLKVALILRILSGSYTRKNLVFIHTRLAWPELLEDGFWYHTHSKDHE